MNPLTPAFGFSDVVVAIVTSTVAWLWGRGREPRLSDEITLTLLNHYIAVDGPDEPGPNEFLVREARGRQFRRRIPAGAPFFPAIDRSDPLATQLAVAEYAVRGISRDILRMLTKPKDAHGATLNLSLRIFRSAYLMSRRLRQAQREQAELMGTAPSLYRAHQTFRLLEALVTKRLRAEQLGDALEWINEPGRLPWEIRLKVASTVFWVLVNSAREVCSIPWGRKTS